MGELFFMLLPMAVFIEGERSASTLRPDLPLKNLRLPVPAVEVFLTTQTNPKSTSLTVPSCVL